MNKAAGKLEVRVGDGVPLSKSMRSWTVAESVGASGSSGCEKGLLLRGAAAEGLLL